eukprot:SAG31_NODE_228_length_19803_cov_29.496498_2_plen_216_part_00
MGSALTHGRSVGALGVSDAVGEQSSSTLLAQSLPYGRPTAGRVTERERQEPALGELDRLRGAGWPCSGAERLLHLSRFLYPQEGRPRSQMLLGHADRERVRAQSFSPARGTEFGADSVPEERVRHVLRREESLSSGGDSQGRLALHGVGFGGARGRDLAGQSSVHLHGNLALWLHEFPRRLAENDALCADSCAQAVLCRGAPVSGAGVDRRPAIG